MVLFSFDAQSVASNVMRRNMFRWFDGVFVGTIPVQANKVFNWWCVSDVTYNAVYDILAVIRFGLSALSCVGLMKLVGCVTSAEYCKVEKAVLAKVLCCPVLAQMEHVQYERWKSCLVCLLCL